MTPKPLLLLLRTTKNLVLTLTLFVAATGCSKQLPPATQPPPTAPEQINAALSQPQGGDEFAAVLPHVGGPAGYTGAESCQACHEDEFASWHGSYHRTMTQFPSRQSIQASFHNIVLTNDGSRFTLSQTGDEFWVNMAKITPPAPGATNPEPIDVRIGLVTGSHHMQVFWVPGGEGNTQIGFPFTWLIPEKRWVPRNSTFIRPPDAVHRSEIWNVVCSRCHATAIEPRVDAASRTVTTRAADLGISCEACHGPGENHAHARLLAQQTGASPDPETLRKEIIHPKKIDPARSSQICGFCHSMKWIDKSEAWRQNGFRFRPGDDLEATTPIIRPSQGQAVSGLAEFLARNPDLLLDYFWPDGMVRVSGREYNGLIDSPCVKNPKFSCLSCHSLHDSDPNDQLARDRAGNAACTQCHESFRQENALFAHTRHASGSPGSECYNCHMPHTTYGVLKAIRSHQISSPNAGDDLAAGRPNACNLCHLDKPLKWTADRLSEWFPKQQPPPSPAPAPSAPPQEDQPLSHAVQLALSGDAGQRVLIAWHLGWSPALQASGAHWAPAILAQLLDDPYAAVRCVAERSLRGSSQTPSIPPDYDYVIEPKSRPPMREAAWTLWRQRLPPEFLNQTFVPNLPLQPRDLEAQRQMFEDWVKRRDDRPLRLRE